MKIHRFTLVFFATGLVVHSISYFLIERRLDKTTLISAGIYVVGILTSLVAYLISRYRKKRAEVSDWQS